MDEESDSDNDSLVSSCERAGDVFSLKAQLPTNMHFMEFKPFEIEGIYENFQNKPCPGKNRTSLSHRKKRIKGFQTRCRNLVDERRLRIAANNDDYKTVMELLDRGVDPSCYDEKKRTPLHFASSQGNDTTVRILLDHGADTNMKDVLGNTPLHLAACTNQVPVITQLLNAGTDVCSADKHGRTPLTLAQSKLKLISEERSFSSAQAKSQLLQVCDMMKAYLRVTEGTSPDFTEIDELCDRLGKTSTREEVDSVNSMLFNFTALSIERRDKRPTNNTECTNRRRTT